MNMRSSAKRRDSKSNAAPLSDSASVATASPSARRQPRPLRSLMRRSTRPVAPELSPSDHAILLRRYALAEAQRGHHEEAIALFTQVLDYTPDSANDYNNRGLVYFHLGEADKALADYNKALELNPNLDSVYNNRANYFAAQGQHIDAILDYDTAIDLNPHNIRAWINQGITFRDLQMYDRAIENFELALCFGGALDAHIYTERGRTYQLWGDWNCAIADYHRAIAELDAAETPSAQSVRLSNQVNTWLNELLYPLL